MNVDAVVSSLTERDKWRRRLNVLNQTLGDVRARRERWRARLKRAEAELRKLGEYSEALIDHAERATRGRSDGTANRTFLAR
jgi:uncharacterized coiled-coil DUF342 family protein